MEILYVEVAIFGRSNLRPQVALSMLQMLLHEAESIYLPLLILYYHSLVLNIFVPRMGSVFGTFYFTRVGVKTAMSK